ncbi:sugar phosphorylase [Candidatus Woesearchaeota archaeon]|nr:sugar phosphorylase [Candidatus Woesearchaeota archaeon]
MNSKENLILEKLKKLYPDNYNEIGSLLFKLISETKSKISCESKNLFSENDVVLICYGDHVYSENEKTLKTFLRFSDKFFKGIFNRVHFLPFFPYSSDDGFSVIDYYKIDSKLGDWEDVLNISKEYSLMFDFVMNHVSAKSEWFQKFLCGDEKYKNYFISFDSKVDTSKVFRPRTHELLTKFHTSSGNKFVWTTFSEDQIDLNVSNPNVFLELMQIFLFFIEKNAKAIRLDAIAYLWKELGTSCIHLDQTHEIVKIMKLVIELLDTTIWLVTETNVPHADNISYFGSGDEAQLVYNFSLPPLLIYSFLNKNSKTLTSWAKGLTFPNNTTFFNFTASHDGIGLMPLNGILEQSEIDKIANYVSSKGGKINYRDSNGKKIPYEMNITYIDAFEYDVEFLASQAIQLVLRGVPGIYFNSIIGSHNWMEGVTKLGYNRAINREKFEYSKLCDKLENNKIFIEYSKLINARINEPLFNPDVEQEIIDIDERLFCVVRKNENDKILCITNLSTDFVIIEIEKYLGCINAKEIVSQEDVSESFALGAYQSVWLKKL